MDDPDTWKSAASGRRYRAWKCAWVRMTRSLCGSQYFPGLLEAPQQTAEAMRDGWFHTGDQGEVNAAGNWRIAGRIKNLIVLGSGHKISPETIEGEIVSARCLKHSRS